MSRYLSTVTQFQTAIPTPTAANGSENTIRQPELFFAERGIWPGVKGGTGEGRTGEGVRSQASGVRRQESGVGSRESGVRSQESGVRSQGIRRRCFRFLCDAGFLIWDWKARGFRKICERLGCGREKSEC